VIARLLMIVVLVAVSGTAAAQGAMAPDLAASAAATVFDRRCSDLAAEETTQAASALSEVGSVWARVSQSYDRFGTPLLLYWRGLLSQCLNQDQRAIDDFEGFLAAEGRNDVYASMIREAHRRLGQLGVKAPEVRESNPQLVTGAVLGAAGAGFAGLGVALNLSTYSAGRVRPDGTRWTTTVSSTGYRALVPLNRAGFATAISGGVLAGVGLVVALTSSKSNTPTAWVVPAGDGVAFGVAGRF
jgi:hypothetical protein